MLKEVDKSLTDAVRIRWLPPPHIPGEEHQVLLMSHAGHALCQRLDLRWFNGVRKGTAQQAQILDNRTWGTRLVAGGAA